MKLLSIAAIAFLPILSLHAYESQPVTTTAVPTTTVVETSAPPGMRCWNILNTDEKGVLTVTERCEVAPEDSSVVKPVSRGE